MDFPKSIQQLITLRDAARKANNYALADQLRDELIAAGHAVEDNSSGSSVKKNRNTSSFLTVFGSGEISSVGRKIHEYVLKEIQKKEVNIGIITTPAGFQPNVVTVHEEIKEFFEQHLVNFHPKVEIIYANSKAEANDTSIVSVVEDCDYLFMGPGSPTYTVKTLQGSLLLKRIEKKITDGVSLCLSSAAAIAFSAYCLPVYEIYKVGSPLHWMQGLNMYEKILGRQLTVIPHFNNTEGGVKNDTSRCYMGEKRFSTLLSLLPGEIDLMGIDEHTANIWNLQSEKCIVMGKGNITEVVMIL